MRKSATTRKRAAGVAAITLVLVLLLGGTFAWNDYRQHKTNEGMSDGILYKARLVEDYNPLDALDWKVDQEAITKAVNVLNPGNENGDPNDPDLHSRYGDIYVRLQLKEFMEFYPVRYDRTVERYMINEDGAFIRFSAEADAKQFLDKLEAEYAAEGVTFDPDVNRIEQLDMYESLEPDDPAYVEYYYIQTRATDPHGVFGDFILLDIELDETATRNIVKNAPPANAKADQAAKHNAYTEHYGEVQEVDGNGDPIDENDHDNGECLYTPHCWNDDLTAAPVNGAGEETFSDYIQWILGDDVITMEQWKTNFGCQPVKKWVVDTDSPEGWVYWMHPVAPGEYTGNLLEAIDLVNQPGDAFYYALHVDMQAVSFNELDNWNPNADPAISSDQEAPIEVIEALKSSYNASVAKATAVVVTPGSSTITAGQTLQFAATVKGTADISQVVTWAVADCTSTIDDDGLLTVSADDVGKTLVVTATSEAGSIVGRAYVTVEA